MKHSGENGTQRTMGSLKIPAVYRILCLREKPETDPEIIPASVPHLTLFELRFSFLITPHPQFRPRFPRDFPARLDIRLGKEVHNREYHLGNLIHALPRKIQQPAESRLSIRGTAEFRVFLSVFRVETDGNRIDKAVQLRGNIFSICEVREPVCVESDRNFGLFPHMARRLKQHAERERRLPKSAVHKFRIIPKAEGI